jgi:UDP-glucuronate decarboxylase
MGMLLGYLLLPVLLIEVQLSDFLARDSEAMLLTMQQDFQVHDSNYFLRPSLAAPGPGRSLDGAPSRSLATDVEQRLMEDHNVLSRQSLPTATTPTVMKTIVLPDHQRKKILVTGGAGFVGSHLVDKLMMEGHEVIVVDNFFTGQKRNIAHWLHHPLFR